MNDEQLKIQEYCHKLEKEDRILLNRLYNYDKPKKSRSYRRSTNMSVSHPTSPTAIEKAENAITLTDEQNAAMRILRSGGNVFLSGKAGTGKSLVTRVFIDECKKAGKNILVCAPTGIAALNIGGATLHRTFAVPTELFSPGSECVENINLKVINRADIILIDEISMCRADLFQFVANTILTCEKRANHKKQVIVVGDFFQLPPVLTYKDKKDYEKMYGSKLYAFESVKWQQFNFRYVELSNVIRQKDPEHMRSLNNIREGISDLSIYKTYDADNPQAITICGRNNEVSAINRQRLSRLSNHCFFEADTWGYIDNVPTEYRLELAVGARVILLANDDKGRWANGTLAEVTSLSLKDKKRIMIKVEDGSEYELGYHTWEYKEYQLRRRYDGSYCVDTEVIGSFSQLPIKLAYAITIHRSQGQTYDNVNLHPEGIFAEGQLYVALSRCRSLQGMRIVGHLTQKQIKVSTKVIDFYASIRGNDNNSLMITTQERGGQESVKITTEKKQFSTLKGKATRNRIMELIEADPSATSMGIAKTLGINRSAVQKHLLKLTAEGWLHRSGSKKSGRWEVNNAIEIIK